MSEVGKIAGTVMTSVFIGLILGLLMGSVVGPIHPLNHIKAMSVFTSNQCAGEVISEIRISGTTISVKCTDGSKASAKLDNIVTE